MIVEIFYNQISHNKCVILGSQSRVCLAVLKSTGQLLNLLLAAPVSEQLRALPAGT